jgi:hypothetical protein
MIDRIERWLAPFCLDPQILAHVVAVVVELPPHVREDLMHDPAFVLFDYEPAPGTVAHIPVNFAAGGKPARSVVLKRSLRNRPEAFARWVIAHELAHAHLRNAGRTEGEDPEHAADALAAAWGFSAQTARASAGLPNPRPFS